MGFLKSVVFLIVFFLLSFIKASPVHAATCTLTTSPSPVTTNEKAINIEIKTSGLIEGNEYWAQLNNGNIHDSRGVQRFKVVNGVISIQNLNPDGEVNLSDSKTFEAKIYRIEISEAKPRGNSFCSVDFSVQQTTSGGACTIEYLNTSNEFTSNDEIRIKVADPSGNTGDSKVVVKRDKVNGEVIKTFCSSVNELSSGFSVGKFEDGVYYIEILDSCLPFPTRICHSLFGTGDKGGPNPTIVGPIAIPPPICQGGFCNTALGEIQTDPAGFIKRIFGILLSLAGGVALLLIIISGYRLMTSQGNPEKVQAAREQLTSAIVGLLFIIFSIAILTIIGVDILRIPGFGI